MINVLLLIVSYFFMEFVAYSNHKYVMHGFLWKWHKDHHRKDRQQILPENTEDKRFEINDLFFFVYALPAIFLLILGFSFHDMALVFIGIGITLYGLTYFIIHDIIIHNRVRFSYLRQQPNFYIKAIIKAHTAHHRPKSKADFQNYGLLVFPFKYFSN